MRGPALDDRQHVILLHDEGFPAIELDLLPGIRPEKDRGANRDVQRDAIAMVRGCAGFGRDDFALLEISFAVSGIDDPPDCLFAFVNALDQDVVAERSDMQWVDSRAMCVRQARSFCG